MDSPDFLALSSFKCSIAILCLLFDDDQCDSVDVTDDPEEQNP